ncbi:MAG: SpoIIE family protein phosphatase, partial [Bdellovibrionales bacterium]|nr:SpoIIE family protein phosphatase [Bdellovibrionales bacterium]
EMVQKVKKLISDTRDLGRMESELKMAQTVQQTLFPKADAEFDSISVNSYCEPCSECGGDFWFYEKIGENLYLGLGDATGHGASAALITSAARAAISVILRNGVSEPKDILTLLNTAIYDTAKGKITMTFFLMRIHLPTSEMVYVNAAHEPPLFVKNPSPTMRKKDLDVLSEGATHALGRDESAEFEQHSLLLEAGDLITVFSDGIYDVVNPEGVAWGEGNFTRAFIDGLKSSRMTKVCLNKMTDTMNKFRQNSGLVDDVTLVMIKKNR